MNPPLVSILIRSMDRPTLDRALASAAAQTWPEVEIVVVAACGAGHRPLPERYQGRALRLQLPQPDRRLDRPSAANVALEAARGEWLNFLDDDDELLPGHLATLLAVPPPPTHRVLYSRAAVVDAEGEVTGSSGVAGFHAQLYYQNRSAPLATLFHRSLVDEGARFDPAFPVFEDRDFMINCATRTEFRFVDAVTCRWHAHIGESGLGHGDNADRRLEDAYLPRLREKWRPAFSKWLAEPQAQLFLGQHHLRHDGPAQALPYLEEALRRAPNDVNALNLCGMAHFRNGNLERAERLVAQALAALPGHPALSANLQLIRAARAAPGPGADGSPPLG
jgi:glycosyltransferase involved in cell wall biosynthesis